MPTWNHFSLNGETISLDDSLRSTAPGHFIKLPDGVTYYEVAGPLSGPTVILMNGFSIPVYLWDHTFLPLAEAGLRVIRFDLYGRGFSDRPDINYGPDLFDRQILNLLQALNIKTPLHLVGSSMGGIVSSIFTDRHPELVNKLILIDPAGMMEPASFPMKALNYPVIGETVLGLLGEKLLLLGMRADLLHPDLYPEYVSHYEPQMKIHGFRRAILSTLRSGMLYNQQEVYRRLGQQTRPVLILWGKEDATISFASGEKFKEYLPQATFRVIENAGHVPHYELPDVVNPLLVNFLLNG